MNKKSKSFWMYTIILFTVALVLILFSLFLSDNKGNYESRLQGLQNENLTLKNEKKQLETKNAELEAINNGYQEKERSFAEEKAKLETAAETYANAVESIYIADGFCDQGRYRDAKEEIEKVDASILKEKIKNRYDRVKAKIDANI